MDDNISNLFDQCNRFLAHIREQLKSDTWCDVMWFDAVVFIM